MLSIATAKNDGRHTRSVHADDQCNDGWLHIHLLDQLDHPQPMASDDEELALKLGEHAAGDG